MPLATTSAGCEKCSNRNSNAPMTSSPSAVSVAVPTARIATRRATAGVASWIEAR